MIHKEECKCVNCVGKGSPIREIFFKEVTVKILSEMEVYDWLEGFGQISSLAEQNYIRKYGFMLIKMQNQYEDYKRMQDDSQWDATDAAHPAWWRGEKYSAYQAAKLIANILSGEDICKGVMNEPLETMRRSVIKLKRERDKLAHQEENLLNKIETLQKQNQKQALAIGKYQEESERLLNQRDVALEQRKADWDRIHSLEADVNNLRGEITTLRSRSGG